MQQQLSRPMHQHTTRPVASATVILAFVLLFVLLLLLELSNADATVGYKGPCKCWMAGTDLGSLADVLTSVSWNSLKSLMRVTVKMPSSHKNDVI